MTGASKDGEKWIDCFQESSNIVEKFSNYEALVTHKIPFCLICVSPWLYQPQVKHSKYM